LTDLFRRFRGLGVAIVVLAMSAGVVFAAAPQLQPASHPVANADDPGDQGEDQDEQGQDEDAQDEDESEAPETEAPETEEPSEDADVDKAEAEDAEDATGTHGELVSAAAQMPTPEGFRNHGAFVSCVAHMKDATLATIVWETVTPEACAAAKDAKHADKDAAKAEKQAAKDAAKAARDAAKAERKAARDAAKAERKANKGH
jgi:hypothetical protein